METKEHDAKEGTMIWKEMAPKGCDSKYLSLLGYGAVVLGE